jgi:hypothetical protein
MKNLLCLAVAFSPLALAAGPENSSDIRAAGEAYAHLISFEAEPEIAASRLTIDGESDFERDPELRATKIPLFREFEIAGKEWRWFLQAAAHYMTLEERLYVDPGPEERRSIDLEWQGYGGLLEAGIKYPLSEHLSLAPSLGLGISRLKNEASFNNLEPNDFDNPESLAQLFDWQTNASVARAHLGATAFMGSGRDALGFDHFYELGASLGISKYTLGLLLVTGADVEGLSLTFNYDY